MCLAFSKAKSQNVLDGVYVRQFIVRNGDTLETVVKGKVIDKVTLKPLQNKRVEYFSSNGQSLSVLTDRAGSFKFSGLAADSINAKVICSDSAYKMITWQFNTYGISQPRIFNFNFELEKK